MPGRQTCVRCESLLEIGDISVEPIRASSLRLMTRVHRLSHGLSAAAAALLRVRITLAGLAPAMPIPSRALKWALVPGLLHLRLGRRGVGWAFLLGWILLLAVALLNYPYAAAVWWFSLAVAFHAGSIITAVVATGNPGDQLWRLMSSAAIFGGLYTFGYWPIVWLSRGVVIPFVVPANFRPGPAISTSDALLVDGRWRRPVRFNRGELVLYRLGGRSLAGYAVRSGYGIDRIVGVPGDRVELVKGELRVNGVEPAGVLGPLGSTRGFPDIALDLGPDEYAILPTRVESLAGSALERTPLQALSTVAGDDIVGVARWRLRPWSRFGAVR